MESEALKMQFFQEQLERGVRRVFAAQREIATTRIYTEVKRMRYLQRYKVSKWTGILMDALDNPDFSIATSGGGLEMRSNLPKYVRFLDMKEFGNFQIYNRQVWGILYCDTIKEIKFGYGEWIKQNFLAMHDNQLNASIR